MTDTITLPREVVKFVLQHLEWWSDDEPQEKEAIEVLRTALAAEQPKHPGYIIGSHWLETAYSRICAGEAEDDVLRDIGLVRITDGTVQTADIHAIVDSQEALRRDAERLTDEQIDSATAKERDELLDHIYEYGTVAEGILERIRKLARAAIDAAMGDKR